MTAVTPDRARLAVAAVAVAAEWHAAHAEEQRRELWPLHEGQQRVHDADTKVVVALAGTGGGKTSYAPRWCERERDAGTNRDGLVIAPYKILKRVTMPSFLTHFAGQGAWESKVDGIWRFHDGGYVYFASADTPESIEGAHVSWAWLDECGQRQFPVEAWEAVQRRVRYHAGRILGTTTPYVIGWLKALHDDWRGGYRDDVGFVTFPSTANPGFPEDEFERARRTLPAWQFRMFYLAEWDRPAGLVYADVSDESWLPELPTDASHWDWYAGLDFGYNNPTAVVYAVLSPDDVLYVADEYYESGRTDAENARLATRPAKLARAWGDPSAPEAIEEFKQHHWPIMSCARHDPKAGIVEVLERIKTGRLRFVRGRLSELPREMDSYVWDDKRPDVVVKANDHACDALRYLCWMVQGAHRLSAQPATNGARERKPEMAGVRSRVF